jgi:adenylate cyclase
MCCEGRHLRLFPYLDFSTERYPETIARRLRVLNVATWIAAPVGGVFAVTQLLDPTPGMWKPGLVNGLASLTAGILPILNRYSPLAGPLAFTIVFYAAIFADCYLIGVDTGMQFYYFSVTAVVILVVGTERISLSIGLACVAAILIIALEELVPRTSNLQSAEMTRISFIISTLAAGFILFAVVHYAVREAEREHARSESLLANILPTRIAERLKRGNESLIADKYQDVSILFADMAGFTARAGQMGPEELVQFLNRVFTEFDCLVERYDLEKIKTTGDAYMVVCGAPRERRDHAEAIAQLALDMRDTAMTLLDPHGHSLAIRIGICSGPVVAGVVGTRKFFYDVWGDAVNITSRMESTGVPGKIQVAEETYIRLREDFLLEARGEIDVKGKGRLRTWFLVARKVVRPMGAPASPTHRSKRAAS